MELASAERMAKATFGAGCFWWVPRFSIPPLPPCPPDLLILVLPPPHTSGGSHVSPLPKPKTFAVGCFRRVPPLSIPSSPHSSFPCRSPYLQECRVGVPAHARRHLDAGMYCTAIARCEVQVYCTVGQRMVPALRLATAMASLTTRRMTTCAAGRRGMLRWCRYGQPGGRGGGEETMLVAVLQDSELGRYTTGLR